MSTLFAHELGQPLNAVICYSFGLKILMGRWLLKAHPV